MAEQQDTSEESSTEMSPGMLTMLRAATLTAAIASVLVAMSVFAPWVTIQAPQSPTPAASVTLNANDIAHFALNTPRDPKTITAADLGRWRPQMMAGYPSQVVWAAAAAVLAALGGMFRSAIAAVIGTAMSWWAATATSAFVAAASAPSPLASTTWVVAVIPQIALAAVLASAATAAVVIVANRRERNAIRAAGGTPPPGYVVALLTSMAAKGLAQVQNEVDKHRDATQQT